MSRPIVSSWFPHLGVVGAAVPVLAAVGCGGGDGGDGVDMPSTSGGRGAIAGYGGYVPSTSGGGGSIASVGGGSIGGARGGSISGGQGGLTSGGSTPLPNAGGRTTKDECAIDADCTAKAPSSMPTGCLVASCDATHKCSYQPADKDGDGFRDKNCVASGDITIQEGSDCDDSSLAIKPGATEECNNKDDDCNGLVDDAIAPKADQACSNGDGECKRMGLALCEDGNWTGCTAIAGPPSSDFPTCDGKDHDCDGVPDTGCRCSLNSPPLKCNADACNPSEVKCSAGDYPACPPAQGRQPYCRNADGDPYCEEGSCGSYCAPGNGVDPAPGGFFLQSSCQGTESSECDDAATGGDRHPGASESCNGHDDNCDGSTDETLACAYGDQKSQGCGYAFSCGAVGDGVQTCGGASQCAWTSCSVVPTHSQSWLAKDLSHDGNCGEPDGDNWYVTYNLPNKCTAVWGQYVNNLYSQSGQYKVGFWVWGNPSDGSNIGFDVAVDGGTVTASTTQNVKDWTCVEFHNIVLNDCDNAEFRVHFTHDTFLGIPSGHSFSVNRTYVAPEDGGYACQ
jgi:hypothetical protein